MTAFDDILRKLQDATGDVQAQAVITADFALSVQSPPDREKLTYALNAAVVLHWFDLPIMTQMLQVDESEARRRLELLCHFPFVESFPLQGKNASNIHDATRFGWRARLARDQPNLWRQLSAEAAEWFAGRDEISSRIEHAYHLLCADPVCGARHLEELDRHWSGSAYPEQRQSLAQALWELETHGLVEGIARLEVLVCAGESRSARGETAQLGDLASSSVALARTLDHPSGLARACCLQGDVLQSQGKLEAARAAYDEVLTISRRLAEQYPSNAGWQHDLAVAHSKVGDVLQSQGKLKAARASFDKVLAISRRLEEQDPSNVGWKRELAVAHSRVGDVLREQCKLEAARAAFDEVLTISRRLSEQDPSNAVWQRGLAVAYSKVGDLLQSQGKLEEARAASEEALTISRRLAEQDPSNAGWQRGLAVARSRVGDVLKSQGKLEAARVAFDEVLTISRRLAEQDPSNAGWQRGLAVARSRVGDVLQSQGKQEGARAAFDEVLTISRRLAEQDPSNADWQRELAVTIHKIARMASSSGSHKRATGLLIEAIQIFERLVEKSPEQVVWKEELEQISKELFAIVSHLK